jgi:hypothetical protein
VLHQREFERRIWVRWIHDKISHLVLLNLDHFRPSVSEMPTHVGACLRADDNSRLGIPLAHMAALIQSTMAKIGRLIRPTQKARITK